MCWESIDCEKFKLGDVYGCTGVRVYMGIFLYIAFVYFINTIERIYSFITSRISFVSKNITQIFRVPTYGTNISWTWGSGRLR